MEQRKNEFFVFTIILLVIGFLQYFRKIINGLKMSKNQKILYLITLIIFSVSIMIILYITRLNNILSFCIGLIVTTSSEQIAKLFLTIGNNFNSIVSKVIKNYSGIDLSKEINNKDDNKSLKK
jgi:Kef-type K+ transport system membrane component KefB